MFSLGNFGSVGRGVSHATVLAWGGRGLGWAWWAAASIGASRLAGVPGFNLWTLSRSTVVLLWSGWAAAPDGASRLAGVPCFALLTLSRSTACASCGTSHTLDRNAH